MELSASFFYIYNPFSSVTDKRKNRHLLFSPFFPLFRVLFFTLRKKKTKRIFPRCSVWLGKEGAPGAARTQRPPPPFGSGKPRGEGAGGEGTGRDGAGGSRRCPCPPLGSGPAASRRCRGLPPTGPPHRSAPLRALRRCLSLLPCRKATSRRSRSAGKRQSRPNSSSSPSSPSPASPGSWQLRGSSTASGTAPTTGSRRSSRPWGLTPDPTPPLLIR